MALRGPKSGEAAPQGPRNASLRCGFEWIFEGLVRGRQVKPVQGRGLRVWKPKARDHDSFQNLEVQCSRKIEVGRRSGV